MNTAAGAKISNVRVTFLVEVPANTPSPVCITGNHPKLKNWDPRGCALKNVGAGRYQISFLFPKGTYLQYKFTRGDWNTVEKDEEFHDRTNRSLLASQGRVLNLKIENWGDMGIASPKRKHTMSGNIQIHKNFKATKLNNRRTLWVYLPPGYEKNPNQHYPVLYAHDGNNLFDKATAFLGVDWELDETAERLIKEKKIREIIIVGIENTHQRDREYTHVYVPNQGGGKADMYADFIINDIKPFIDKKYRTLKDRQYTAIMGSSLGGLVSLYIAWKYSEIFSMAGVVSPSVWWHNRDIVRMIRKTKDKPPIKIWLDIGKLEGYELFGINMAVRDTRTLRDVLITKGFHLHDDLEYFEDEEGEHNEASWAKRVDKILLYFFGPKFRASKKGFTP